MRYALLDRENAAQQIEQTKKEIEEIDHKISSQTTANKEMESVMRERTILVHDIEDRINSVEDTVFSEFCADIGVENIRQYEERELGYLYCFLQTHLA